MNHQTAVVTIVLLAVFSSTSGLISGGRSLQEIDRQIYCGRSLANILVKLCNDGVDKRTDVGILRNTILSPYYKEHDVVWPWLAHHRAKALGLPSRGKRHQTEGIVNECCEKACSRDELLQYCYDERDV